MDIQYDNPNEIGMTSLAGLPAGLSQHERIRPAYTFRDRFPVYAFYAGGLQNCTGRHKTRAYWPPGEGLMLAYADPLRDTLKALLPLISKKKEDSFLTAQLKVYDEVKQRMQTYVDDAGEKENIHPEFVASIIDELAADDAIFTVDTGMSCVWGSRYINATGKRKMLGSFNHGSMANAMPQAIGAGLACQGRQVIALCGDGGISMLLGDLATITQYKLPVKVHRI